MLKMPSKSIAVGVTFTVAGFSLGTLASLNGREDCDPIHNLCDAKSRMDYSIHRDRAAEFWDTSAFAVFTPFK